MIPTQKMKTIGICAMHAMMGVLGYSKIIHSRSIAMDALTKENQKLRESLQKLSNIVLLYLHEVDALGCDKTIPREVGGQLARLSNVLEKQNDMIRYTVLQVDYRTDDKTEVVRKLKTTQLKG